MTAPTSNTNPSARKANRLRLLLLALPLLLTGCPRNQYVVELTPRGEGIERRLTFHCEDGKDTNGLPNYQAFSPDELAAIRALYPVNGFKRDGQEYTASGVFTGSLPADVGGAGTYRKLSADMGSAGFYVERFRGDDDLADQMTSRFKAADQLVDLIIGWSRMELGHEHGYKNLRKFLDEDFRRDVKNLGLYFWMQQVSDATKAKSPEEFGVRFGQYLVERGYLKLEDLPDLIHSAVEEKPGHLMEVIQRLLADKMGVPAANPVPKSLGFLADPNTANKSWEKYLASTEIYRAKLRHWQAEKLSVEAGNLGRQSLNLIKLKNATNGAWAKVALPPKPAPSEVADGLLEGVLAFEIFNTDDDLTVRLSLPVAPAYSNGQWDDARKQVTWTADLEKKEKIHRLPGFCYAAWAVPQDSFQTNHFGRVLLAGNELLQYCVWRAGLDASQSAQWDKFMAGLNAGTSLKEKLDAFRFSTEPARITNSPTQQSDLLSDLPRKLILSAIEKNAGTKSIKAVP